MLGLLALNESTANIADLQKQASDLQTLIDGYNNQKASAKSQWQQNHFGGQSEGQFNSYIGNIQAQIDYNQNLLNKILDQIAALQAPTPAPAPTSAPTAMPTAADIAAQNIATAEAYRKTAYLIARPGYDYGVGSNARNKFYALGDKMEKDGGLTYSGPGLGASIFESVEKGIFAALPAAARQASPDVEKAVADAFGIDTSTLPQFRLPAPIQTLIGGIKSQIAKDKTPTPIHEPSGQPGPNISNTPPSAKPQPINWLLVGGGVLGAFLLYKAVRR
jgi:hypothetical protein